MKIVILINTSWNIYNFREGLVKHLLSKGHEVIAVAPRDAYSDHLVSWGCQFHAVEIEGTGLNPIKDLQFFVQLYRVLKGIKPDMVLSYTIKPNIYGSMVSSLLSTPIICNVSGLGTVFLWKGALRRFGVLLYWIAFRFSSWIFFQNDQDQNDFLKLVGISPSKTSLLPGSGIDLSKYKPQSKAVSSEKVIFLMVGRLIVEKGVREYVEAARLVLKGNKKAEFWLAGSLDESHSRSVTKEELDGWIAEGVIGYLGHVDPITDLMTQADVIVLPSYREGTSRTLLEGGALGKALITTDVPGCAHVVEDGYNGFLAKPKSASALADKMKLFLSLSPQERQILGGNSRKLIESKFDEVIVIDRYMEKIRDLTSV